LFGEPGVGMRDESEDVELQRSGRMAGGRLCRVGES
jgi:hypothetical protein